MPNSNNDIMDGLAKAPEKLISSRGMQFPDAPRFISQKQRRLLRLDAYEDREFLAVTANIKRQDVVIELGAGLGYMSTVAAKLGKAKEVHAYEGNPALIDYIQKVHHLNGVPQVKVHNAVFGAKDCRVEFFVREEFNASSLSREAQGVNSPITSIEMVPMLDANGTFQQISPSFLICDIEGAEADILPLIDLSCLRCAVVELHPQWIGETGVQAVFAAMTKAGLTFYPKTSNKKVVTFKKGW
jgi:FkbM family methyltransferase